MMQYFTYIPICITTCTKRVDFLIWNIVHHVSRSTFITLPLLFQENVNKTESCSSISTTLCAAFRLKKTTLEVICILQYYKEIKLINIKLNVVYKLQVILKIVGNCATIILQRHNATSTSPPSVSRYFLIRVSPENLLHEGGVDCCHYLVRTNTQKGIYSFRLLSSRYLRNAKEGLEWLQSEPIH